jgi:hypothetical protein
VNQAKYIGMDVRQATISVAVMDSAGKLMLESILETKAVALRYLVLNVLMGLDTPSFTPVALVDSTV